MKNISPYGLALTWGARARTGLASVVLGILALPLASAQAPDRPMLTVAATVTAELAKQVPFPIRVGPPSSIPRNSFLRVRGLPRSASLSEGHAIASGSWAVPLTALPDLTVMVPAPDVGKADVHISLVDANGAVLAEAKTTLRVFPPDSVREPAARPAAATPTHPVDRQRAQEFLAKGNAHLEDGLVATARLLYERAADMGLAQAAMALAGTYDPAELGRLKLRAIPPDAAAAKRWYERARALGAREADQRLQRLDGY